MGTSKSKLTGSTSAEVQQNNKERKQTINAFNPTRWDANAVEEKPPIEETTTDETVTEDQFPF